MKVCLVGSSGGHLTHLYMLKPFWQDKERFWVTFNKEDAEQHSGGRAGLSLLLPDEPEPESIVDQYKTCLESIEKRTPGRNCLLRGGGRSSVFLSRKIVWDEDNLYRSV